MNKSNELIVQINRLAMPNNSQIYYKAYLEVWRKSYVSCPRRSSLISGFCCMHVPIIPGPIRCKIDDLRLNFRTHVARSYIFDCVI